MMTICAPSIGVFSEAQNPASTPGSTGRSVGFAVVPFQAFGVTRDCGWFRLSVGAVSVAEIEAAMPRVRAAIEATSTGNER